MPTARSSATARRAAASPRVALPPARPARSARTRAATCARTAARQTTTAARTSTAISRTRRPISAETKSGSVRSINSARARRAVTQVLRSTAGTPATRDRRETRVATDVVSASAQATVRRERSKMRRRSAEMEACRFARPRMPKRRRSPRRARTRPRVVFYTQPEGCFRRQRGAKARASCSETFAADELVRPVVAFERPIFFAVAQVTCGIE